MTKPPVNYLYIDSEGYTLPISNPKCLSEKLHSSILQTFATLTHTQSFVHIVLQQLLFPEISNLSNQNQIYAGLLLGLSSKTQALNHFQGSRATLIIAKPLGSTEYYRLTEDQPKLTTFVFSCFVGECEAEGLMMWVLHCCIFCIRNEYSDYRSWFLLMISIRQSTVIWQAHTQKN